MRVRPSPVRDSAAAAQGEVFQARASVMVNVDDGSFTLLPEVQFKPTEHLEVRWLGNIQRGARTEFGEKEADLRVEVRVPYYFDR